MLAQVRIRLGSVPRQTPSGAEAPPTTGEVTVTRYPARVGLLLGTLIPLVLLQGGCVEQGGEAEPGFSEPMRLDSAGVQIVQSDGRHARGNTAASVDSVPDVIIGGSENSAEVLLHRVEGVAALDNGSVLVAEGGAHRIMSFGRDGQLRWEIGRSGEGPGEFRSIELVPPATQDSVVVFDGRLRRYTSVEPDREDVRTFDARHESGRPVGLVGGGVLLSRLEGPLTTGTPGPYRPTVTYKLWAPGQATVDTVVTLGGRRNFVSLEVSEFPAHLPVFFEVNPSAATDGEDFFLVESPAPEVRQYDPAGRLKRIVRLREPERTVTEETLGAAIEERAQRYARDADAVPLLRRAYQQMPSGTMIPSFEALAVGPRNSVWARLFQENGAPEEWMVFSEAGEAVGVVRMPRGFEMHQTTSDVVLGLWTDSLGVEQVRGHRLRWRSPLSGEPGTEPPR